MDVKLYFEHHKEPLLPKRLFARRVLRFTAASLGLLALSLLIGIWSYHYLENLSWIDAFLNASMIMGGMGPVAELHTTAGKLFASFYALYCGAILLIAIGIFLAPIFHRLMHRFHLDLESMKNDD
jgi:hypothetical protein